MLGEKDQGARMKAGGHEEGSAVTWGGAVTPCPTAAVTHSAGGLECENSRRPSLTHRDKFSEGFS